LEVLIKERPRLTAALDKLRVFSNTATQLVNDTQADLVKNLKNLEPTIRALADVGPDLDASLAGSTVFPFTQNFVDRAVRGDYFNVFAEFDLTIPKLKSGLLLGTHWGQLAADIPPAPGDPAYLNYTLDPLHAGSAASPPGPPPQAAPPPPGPLAPQAPPPGPGQPSLQFSGPLPGPPAPPQPGPLAPLAPAPGLPPTGGGG
jgi:phospholipid/cholesterol/gamma-HCH transport system substrate-binding protein